MNHDTLHRVEVPEGAQLFLRVAGPVRRATAALTDWLIRGVAYLALAMVLGLLSAVVGEGPTQGLLLIGFFLLWWAYPIYFEVRHDGATPGKKMTGLRAVRASGQPVDLQASVARNVLRSADFLPVAYGFVLASVLATRRFQRLGDLAAGTVVIYAEPAPIVPSVPEGHWTQQVEPVPPTVPLTREEQAAIVAYRGRLTRWPEGRQIELADQAVGLTGDVGPEGRQRLVGIGRWLEEGGLG